MSPPIFVLPESPPDTGTFWFVGFNVEWLPIVLAAVQALRDNRLWVDGETLDAEGQIDVLLDLLMENLD